MSNRKILLFIICIVSFAFVTFGCRHAENATSGFRLNENRASTLIYMAQMVGSCHGSMLASASMAPRFKQQQNMMFYPYSDEQLANPTPELKKAMDDSIDSYVLYTLQLHSSSCNNSVCSDLGYIIRKYPADFVLLNTILAQGANYQDQDGVLAAIAAEGEYEYEEYLPMLLDAYNLSALNLNVPTERGKSNNAVPYTQYAYPLDFGYSPWDFIELERTLVELERVRCPLASEAFVTRYLTAIDKMEASLGPIPPKYATYAGRLSYFAQFSFIKMNMLFMAVSETENGMANITPEMFTNSASIDLNAVFANQQVFARIIPGYNEIMFYGKLISSYYYYPEQFIIMHLQYPEHVAEFYRHIRDHRPIYSYSLPNADYINQFFAQSYVPQEFGDNPMDIIMIAKFWQQVLPQNPLMPMSQVRKGIDRVIQSRASMYPMPQQYLSDIAMQQYFGQFRFMNNTGHN